MKIIKGSKWLKRDFIEQLEQLFETNHVVEIDYLVNFEDKEQFVKNMLIRTEFAIATPDDIKRQDKIEFTKKTIALKNRKHQDKLEQEEKQLQAKMELYDGTV